MGFVPRTCSASIGIDTLLPGVLICDVTMGIPWATASRSGGMHYSDRVNLPICSPAATRKSGTCSVPRLVEHRHGSCGTLWDRKSYATRCDNEVRRAWLSYTCSPRSLLCLRVYRRHTHSEALKDTRGRSWKSCIWIAFILLCRALSVRSVAHREQEVTAIHAAAPQRPGHA